MNMRENFKLNLVLESKVSSPVLATGFYLNGHIVGTIITYSKTETKFKSSRKS